MRVKFLHTALLGLLSVSLWILPLPAQATASQQFTISRENVLHLKIIGNKYDHIHFFIQDKSDRTFRLAELSQVEAESILARFKAGESITVQTVANSLGYMDVMSWQ